MSNVTPKAISAIIFGSAALGIGYRIATSPERASRDNTPTSKMTGKGRRRRVTSQATTTDVSAGNPETAATRDARRTPSGRGRRTSRQPGNALQESLDVDGRENKAMAKHQEAVVRNLHQNQLPSIDDDMARLMAQRQHRARARQRELMAQDQAQAADAHAHEYEAAEKSRWLAKRNQRRAIRAGAPPSPPGSDTSSSSTDVPQANDRTWTQSYPEDSKPLRSPEPQTKLFRELSRGRSLDRREANLRNALKQPSQDSCGVERRTLLIAMFLFVLAISIMMDVDSYHQSQRERVPCRIVDEVIRYPLEKYAKIKSDINLVIQNADEARSRMEAVSSLIPRCGSINVMSHVAECGFAEVVHKARDDLGKLVLEASDAVSAEQAQICDDLEYLRMLAGRKEQQVGGLKNAIGSILGWQSRRVRAICKHAETEHAKMLAIHIPTRTSEELQVLMPNIPGIDGPEERRLVSNKIEQSLARAHSNIALDEHTEHGRASLGVRYQPLHWDRRRSKFYSWLKGQDFEREQLLTILNRTAKSKLGLKTCGSLDAQRRAWWRL